MNSTAKILVAAVAIFIAGGVTGGILGANYGRRSMNIPPDQAQIAQRIRSNLKSRAGLGDEQLVKIDPIIQKTASRLEAERQDTMRKVWFIFSDFHAEIAGPGSLTAEQKDKLAQLEREHVVKLNSTPSPTP